MSVYLDTSTLVPLLANDALTERGRAWFARQAGPFVVSDFAAAEFASALGAKLRRREIIRREMQQAFGALDEWMLLLGGSVPLSSVDVAQATAWLRRFDLSLRAPDALDLAMAMRLGVPVATFDSGMATAATALRLPLAVA